MAKVTRVPYDGTPFLGGKGVALLFAPMPEARPFLRANPQPPRASQFKAAPPDLIDDIWADILGRLADPIHVTDSATERVVEVLDLVGRLEISQLGLVTQKLVK